MNIDLWLAFTLASLVLIIVPGPNVSMIVGVSLRHGTRGGFMAYIGSNIAQILQLLVTVLGLASIVLFMAEWFEVLRWFGVAFLIYLGIKAWLGSGLKKEIKATAPCKSLLGQGFIVGISNPKSLLFLGAFFPQFIDPVAPISILSQSLILAATYFTIALISDGAYVILAGKARVLFDRPVAGRLLNKITGAVFFTAAAGLVGARQQ